MIQRSQAWLIGQWTVDPDSNDISHGALRVHLTPKAMAVLLMLAQHAGRCVLRQQLIDSIWERQLVQDDALTRVVADLRKALHNPASPQEYIATVPKRGYRLIADAHVLESPDSPQISASMPSKAAEANAIQSEGKAPPPPQVPPNGRRRAAVALTALLALSITWNLLGHDQPTEVLQAHLKERLIAAIPVTSENGLEIEPRWLNEGEAFVYTKLDSHQAKHSRLILFRMHDRSQTILVDDGQLDLCPTPSPDGKFIAWQRYTDDTCTLMLRPINGAAPQQIALCSAADEQASCPEFSQDSQSIYYSAELVAGTSKIHRFNLVDGKNNPITRPGPSNIDIKPRLSPDGKWLAFDRRSPSSNGQIFRILADGSGTEHAVQSLQHGNRGFDWSNTSLLIGTDAIEYPGLVLWPTNGEQPVLIGARGGRNPDFSKNGAIVFEVAQYTGNLWLADHDQSNLLQLTHSLKHDGRPAFAPNGDDIAYISNRSGRETVWIRNLSTQSEVSAALPADQRWSNPSWSADGRRIVVSYLRDEHFGVCVYQILTQQLDCPDQLRGFNKGAMLPNGDILVSAEERGCGSLQRFSLTMRNLKPLIDRSICHWKQVDQLIAYISAGASHISVIDSENPDKPIAVLPLSTHPWALHRNGILWAEPAGDVVHWRQTAFNGAKSTPTFAALLGRASEIAVSADGQRVVIAKMTDLRTDLMVAF